MLITGFGWVYLTALVGVMALRRCWLPPLLICAAMFHAPAIAIVGAKPHGGGTGISPWFVTACAACVHLVFLACRHRGLAPVDAWTRRMMLGWSVFFALAIVSAFVLPWLFAGVDVHALGHRRGFGIAPVPLAWSTSNLVQAVNSALLWGVMLYLPQMALAQGFLRRLAIGVAIAVTCGLLLALCQRLHEAGIVPELAWFRDSLNPSYVQRVGGGLQGFARVAWPFPEPSYGAVAFAGVFGSGVALCVFSTRHAAGIALALAGAVGVGNSLGIGGMLAAATGAALVLLAVAVCLWRDGIANQPLLAKKGAALAAAMLAVPLAGYALAWTPLAPYSLPAIIDALVTPRLQGVEPSGSTRVASLATALSVLHETTWLGAGLGSNRASSYVASLFSNLGVGPTLLFLWLAGMQMGRLWHLRDQPAALVVLFGSLCAAIGVSLAIPDLNWPAWWIWLLAGLAVCTATHGAVNRSHAAAGRSLDPG